MSEPEVDKDMPIPAGVKSVRDMFPKKYLATEDLKGRDVNLTILKATRRWVHNQKNNTKEIVNVIHFVEMQDKPEHERKCWILNVTNGDEIARISGIDDPHEWDGKGIRITLWPNMDIRAFGHVGAIRVRPKAPSAATKSREVPA